MTKLLCCSIQLSAYDYSALSSLSSRARNCKMSSLVVGALSPERGAATEEEAYDEWDARSIGGPEGGCVKTLTRVVLMRTKMNRARIAAAKMTHRTITTYIV